MEYQRIINLLNNTTNQPSRFRSKNWVEKNYDSRGMHKTNVKLNLKLQW